MFSASSASSFTNKLSAALLLVTFLLAGVATSNVFASREKVSMTINKGWPYASCFESPQRTGYFSVNRSSETKYFYWFVEAETNPENAPVVLWLSGGPGCSSSLGNLMELGPCRMNEQTGELERNPAPWTTFASVIFLDQPCEVGFSKCEKSGLIHNETQVGIDANAFMQEFFKNFPQYQKNKFIVSAESFGGNYGPSVARAINRANINPPPGHVHVNLWGVSLGNGLTNSANQYPAYAELAYHWCKTVRGAPCVSKEIYEVMLSELPKCEELIKKCASSGDTVCVEATQWCNRQIGYYQSSGLNLNPYDIRAQCQGGGLCYPMGKVTEFLNRADVKAALGADPTITWSACSMTVNSMFAAQWQDELARTVAELLASNVRMMFYAGDDDFIVNWIGVKNVTLQMQWPGQTQFRAARDHPWYVNDVPAGFARWVSGPKANVLLSFVQVHNAGHMVPMNQPLHSCDMLKHLVNDEPFTGYIPDL